MLDIKYVVDNIEEVTKKLSLRNVASKSLKEIVELYNQLKKEKNKLESIHSEKNAFSKHITQLTKEEKKNKLNELSSLTDQENKIKKFIDKIDITYKTLLLSIPNIPLDDVIPGKNEGDNKVTKEHGDKKSLSFAPKNHLELGISNNIIDVERAAKVSGSRFGYLKGDGALLWLALVQYALEVTHKHGFTLFMPPVLVKKHVMENSGYDSYLDGQEAYYIEKDDLFLVGTGEHALLPYHSDEILKEEDLPMSYSAYSSCFRRESGSYGKDTKGILRVHQFEKLEMLVIAQPSDSRNQFDRLLSVQEKIIQGLQIPYQLLSVCTGDLPKPSAKVVDLECWIPSEKKYRETHSASNCTDYQARRNKIRYKDSKGKSHYPHILNATGITPRTLIALIENYQQSDGSINIPEILQPYMQGQTVIKHTK
ncbi:serine--tRNA ligase [Patescibacteria group bacterium]